MTLTATNLAEIRDEVGTSEPPTDTDLRRSYDELGHWILVAVRILKRRRAAAGAGGDVQQVNVPGAISVTLSRGDLASLDRRIERLEARYAQETGEGGGDGAARSSRLTRRTAR